MDIWVGNLPTDVTVDALREAFAPFGQVETAVVVRHPHGGGSGGLGFVGMPARHEGMCAVLGIHGRNMGGQTITAAEVRPMDPVSGVCHARCRCQSGNGRLERPAPSRRQSP